MGFIYRIRNTATNQEYVGKTTKTVEERLKKHFRLARGGSETFLHRAIRMYGEDVFEVSILEECADCSLNDAESKWITALSSLAPSGYNLTGGGDGGNTSLSENYKRSMENRRSYAGEGNPNFGKLGENSPNFGSTRTEEQKKNMRAGLQSAWDDNDDRKEVLRQRMIEKNPMKGKTPKNAIKVKFDGVIYNSMTEAQRITKKSGNFLKKNGEILNVSP